MPHPFKARIEIMLKPGVLDPEGEAVRHALDTLGFAGIDKVRQGKLIEIDMEAESAEEAAARAREMCEKLLANTVIEDYRVEISGR